MLLRLKLPSKRLMPRKWPRDKLSSIRRLKLRKKESLPLRLLLSQERRQLLPNKQLVLKSQLLTSKRPLRLKPSRRKQRKLLHQKLKLSLQLPRNKRNSMNLIRKSLMPRRWLLRKLPH